MSMNTVPSVVMLLIVSLASVSCQSFAAQKQLEQFSVPAVGKSYESVCANSTADRFFSVRSKAQCIHECQHGGERSACVGVNYRQVANVCEVYNQCPASYIANETGCQYLRREMTADQKNCSVHIVSSVPAVYVMPGTEPVTALMSYNNQLFVSRLLSGKIAIYDSTNFQGIRNITISGSSKEFVGMTFSPADNLLYLCDQSNEVVYAVNLPLDTASDIITPTSWPVPTQSFGLSVNKANNVLLAEGSNVDEYTSQGARVQQIPMGYSTTMHAIETPSGALAVSTYGTFQIVRLIFPNGTVLNHYGTNAPGSGPGQLQNPSCLAVDKDGFVVVCDTDNSRVLVMNPTLSEVRELPTNDTGTINNPKAMWLDQSQGRLYVGEGAAPYRVLVFEDMFNIGEAFNSMTPVN